MDFLVLSNSEKIPDNGQSTAYLWEDNWNDWYIYKTMYYLTIFDSDGSKHEIGRVKIGEFNWKIGQVRPNLQRNFTTLDSSFFSLGQDADYYLAMMDLGASERISVLSALKDVVYNRAIYAEAREERVMTESLLRDQSIKKIQFQYPAILKGTLERSSYSFKYVAPFQSEHSEMKMRLEFAVNPYHLPPSNIHVLIGRNGVGKTRVLKAMANSLVDPESRKDLDGYFETAEDENWFFDSEADFANLVSVSFSAFDSRWTVKDSVFQPTKIRYTNVGLPIVGYNDSADRSDQERMDFLLSENFADRATNCISGVRGKRWKKALDTLETDSLFADIGISDLFQIKDFDALRMAARESFKDLSSGHKIVLLATTGLIESVEERTLVLIDEPEAHLHPPLLSAFLRALSDLLVDRNGVAIIATHSPVVVQEVPSSCVWKIMRSGSLSKAERPEIETFAENLSTLTREVFGLEVDRSGFHKMIGEVVESSRDFDEVMTRFNGAVGSQGQALVRAMLARRDRKAVR